MGEDIRRSTRRIQIRSQTMQRRQRRISEEIGEDADEMNEEL